MRKLTLEQEIELVAAYMAGETSPTVASRYDVHPSTIKRIARKHNAGPRKGGVPPKLSPDKLKEALALYAAGAPTAALAELYGIDPSNLRKKARLAGLHRGRPHSHIAASESFDKLPPEICLIRDERSLGYHNRTLTGAICGDPPVGFSALDQR